MRCVIPWTKTELIQIYFEANTSASVRLMNVLDVHSHITQYFGWILHNSPVQLKDTTGAGIIGNLFWQRMLFCWKWPGGILSEKPNNRSILISRSWYLRVMLKPFSYKELRNLHIAHLPKRCTSLAWTIARNRLFYFLYVVVNIAFELWGNIQLSIDFNTACVPL